MEKPQVKIAIVGMAGSGKTVLTTVLAMRISQKADQGMFLTPIGENLRQTLKYVQQNWQTLQNGQWPPSTPAGEVANLKWYLITGSADDAEVRFADCAGQDVRAIFSSEHFNPDQFPEDQKQLFAYLNSANILLLLVNMEDLLGKSSAQALDNSLDLYQMIYVLSKETDIPRKIAVVFSQYDRYRAEVDQQYNGNLVEYFRANLPQVYSEYVRTKSFELFPVAAVEQTQQITDDNGNVVAVPQRGFSSYNIEELIQWIINGIAELTPQLKPEEVQERPAPKPEEMNQACSESKPNINLSVGDRIHDAICGVGEILGMILSPFVWILCTLFWILCVLGWMLFGAILCAIPIGFIGGNIGVIIGVIIHETGNVPYDYGLFDCPDDYGLLDCIANGAILCGVIGALIGAVIGAITGAIYGSGYYDSRNY